MISHKSRHTFRRLGVERLEARRLLAYDISFNAGVVSVEGGANDDIVDIRYDGGDVRVDIRNSAGNLVESYNHNATDVQRIDVHTFDGSDHVTNTTFKPMRAWGGNGDDALLGSFAADELYGESGRDQLEGSGGDDLFDGGTGDDRLLGGAGNDDMRGGSGNDWYFFDRYSQGQTSIVEVPDADVDVISFAHLTQGVVFSLASTAVQTISPGLSVQLNSILTISNVLGTDYNDRLVGNPLANYFESFGGDDELIGAGGSDILSGYTGNDVLEGGADNDRLSGFYGNDTYRFGSGNLGHDELFEDRIGDIDTLDFSQFSQAVTVNLGFRTAVNNSRLWLDIEDSTEIENVVGSAFGDTIIGNSRPNLLRGGGGSDYIIGSEGNDVLEGGADSDTLIGGNGDDTYRFGGGYLGSDRINEEVNRGSDTLDFSLFGQGVVVNLGSATAVNNSRLTLTLDYAEGLDNVIGSAYADQITGNSQHNVLRGGGGNDTLRGGAGTDTLYGEGGSDFLSSDAVDLLFGGLGQDYFDGKKESSSWLNPNPNPSHYKDWGTT